MKLAGKMLTEAQEAAATAREDNVLVEAGPGTGKSTLLAARAAHLINECGVEPRKILVLCFTRSGAQGIKRKVIEATGQEPKCLTFHQYAFELVKPTLAEGVQVATELETETALRGLYEGGAKLPKSRLPNITTVRKAIMHYESGKHPVDGPAREAIATVLLRLSEVGRVPLFDLMPQALETFDHETFEFEHVLIDESQDVNHNEELVASSSGRNLFAVGSRAQGIFGWRGAIDNAFESLDPKRYELTESFRFGENIADAVNVIGRRLGAPDVVGLGKDCPVMVMSSLHGIEPDVDSLFLCRTNFECSGFSARGLAMHVRRHHVDDPLGDGDENTLEAARELGLAAASTVHSAKGHQADTVYVCQGEQKWDDRLMYVAASRARKRLRFVENA